MAALRAIVLALFPKCRFDIVEPREPRLNGHHRVIMDLFLVWNMHSAGRRFTAGARTKF